MEDAAHILYHSMGHIGHFPFLPHVGTDYDNGKQSLFVILEYFIIINIIKLEERPRFIWPFTSITILTISFLRFCDIL